MSLLDEVDHLEFELSLKVEMELEMKRPAQKGLQANRQEIW